MITPAALPISVLISLAWAAVATPAAAQPLPQPRGEPSGWPDLFLGVADARSTFAVEAVSIEERLGETPHCTAQGRLPDRVAPEQIVGQRAMLGVRTSPDSFRYCQGFVGEVQTSVAPEDGRWFYEIEIVPWTALLRHTARCEIFQDLTVPQILERVFARYPFAEYELRLGGRYPQRPLEVQYRETDSNFVHRLLEHEGMYYFFEHTDEGHRLVVTDAEARAPAGPALHTGTGEASRGVSEWSRSMGIAPTRYSLADHVPDSGPEPVTGSATIRNRRGSELEVFDYPGEYRTVGEANRYAQLRLDELRAGRTSYRGLTNHLTLTAGQLVRVDGEQFLVTGMHLQAMDGRGDPHLQLTAVPASTRYRSSRNTPKPIIQGVQSARVVAIESDGVRVRFPWDRDPSHQRGPRLRVGGADRQHLAVGGEVLVGFDEGDPNRPILIGTVSRAR